MLSTPAPFPQIGCHALIAVDPTHPANAGGTRPLMSPTAYLAVRLLRREGAVAVVSAPAIPGASGQRRIPFSALLDATDLNPAEAAELEGLRADARAGKRFTLKKAARYEELMTREGRASILARQLARAQAQARHRERRDGSAHEAAFA